MIYWGDFVLYLFVEGPDDKRLISHLFSDIQEKQIYEYATKKQSSVSNLIKVINKNPEWEYIFFTDSDTKSAEERRNDIKNKWNDIDEERIVVVCLEIESWYYAGMSQELCNKYKIKYEKKADDVCKERFISLISKSRRTRTEILIESANNFDIKLACQRNKSFDEFYKCFLQIEKEELPLSCLIEH